MVFNEIVFIYKFVLLQKIVINYYFVLLKGRWVYISWNGVWCSCVPRNERRWWPTRQDIQSKPYITILYGITLHITIIWTPLPVRVNKTRQNIQLYWSFDFLFMLTFISLHRIGYWPSNDYNYYKVKRSNIRSAIGT